MAVPHAALGYQDEVSLLILVAQALRYHGRPPPLQAPGGFGVPVPLVFS